MIDPRNIPEHWTKKDIEKEYWYYVLINRKLISDEGTKLSHRMYQWRTIWRAISTPIQSHWWKRRFRYDWTTCPVSRQTVYDRLRRWRSFEDAVNKDKKTVAN